MAWRSLQFLLTRAPGKWYDLPLPPAPGGTRIVLPLERSQVKNACDVVRRQRAGGPCVAIVQVQELIESGVHFGHRASRWNPKMRPFIYGKRNLIHIIDLRETVRGLLRAYRYLTQIASRGSLVVFVGTKRQAKEAVEREAARCTMPFVSERWLGGTLTNYRTIRDRLKRLRELEGMWLPAGEKPDKMDMNAYMKTMLNESGKHDLAKAPDTAEIRGYSKKMVATLNRELTKLQRNLSG